MNTIVIDNSFNSFKEFMHFINRHPEIVNTTKKAYEAMGEEKEYDEIVMILYRLTVTPETKCNWKTIRFENGSGVNISGGH